MIHKDDELRVRILSSDKKKIQFILDQKYMGATLSNWVRRKIQEEIKAYEKANGVIPIEEPQKD